MRTTKFNGNKTVTVSLVDMLNRLATDVDLDQFSLNYCHNRLKNEGVQFLTKTLPKLASSVLSSLEKGYFDRPTNFTWKARSLRHFRSLLNGIFDPRTGYVRDDVDAVDLYRVRQFSEYVYKLALDFTEDQLSCAESEFVSDEEAMQEQQIDFAWANQLRKDFETYYQAISSAEPYDVFTSFRPRPPSGTYSGRDHTWYTKRYRDCDPSPEYKGFEGYFKAYPGSPRRPRLAMDTSDFSEVLFVPKDSRGPRVIVREPFRRSLAHLSFNDWFTRSLERESSYRLNFRSQQVNRSLAELSSRDKSLSTLDLSKASDSVDIRIVRTVFRNSPACRFFVNRRTEVAKLPSGRKLALTKLAGMGSGLTFPTMSLLISLTITRQIVNEARIPYKQARKLVYVYGDDIIVPTCYYKSAVKALSKVNLHVNPSKSYTNSFFRESCGGDFYNGQNVGPVRLKLSNSKPVVKNLTLQLKSSFALLQLERHCRELVKNGMISLADLFYSSLEKVTGKLPLVSGSSPVLGRYTLIPPKYSQDASGNYEPIRVLIATSKKVEVDDCCPYIHLSTKLADRDQHQLAIDEYYQQLSIGQSFQEVTIPREIRYVRKHVSAFRLMG